METYKIERWVIENKYPLIILVAAIYFIWIAPTRPNYPIKDYTFFGLIALGFFFGFNAELDRIKKDSPHFVCNPLNFSLGCEPYSFFDNGIPYFLFRIGGFKSKYWNGLGKDGCFIIPQILTKRYRENYAGDVIIQELEFDELSLSSQRLIKQYDLKPPYIEGIEPLDLQLDEKDIQLYLQSRQLKSDINNLMDEKDELIHKRVNSASNMVHSLSKPRTIRERVFGAKE